MRRARWVACGSAWGWAAVLITAVLAPVAITDPYVLHVATLFLMYAILGMGLSVVVAYAGLLDLGYVAFFAVGAYYYAIFNATAHLPFILALPSAMALAATVGVILGFPSLRVRGDYLAVVTLAFGEMVRQVLQNWTTVTHGPEGIPGVRGPNFFGLEASQPWQYYLIVLACTTVAVVILKRLARSPVARIWEATRDEELAARSSGINSTAWLLLAFAIGASFAGVVGVLFAAIQRFVSPESFVLNESILVLSIVVLAGGKSLPRIFLAAAILYGLPELLRDIQEYRTLVFGLMLVGFTIIDHKVAMRSRGRRHEQGVISSECGRTCGFPEVLRSSRAPVTKVHLSNVAKDFAGLQALQDVSFEVACAGRVVALVGPNGAGKTTLFNCISGLLRAERGTIDLGGIGNVAGWPAHRVGKAGVARTFQRVRLFSSMSVRSNVEIGAYCQMRVPVVRALVPGISIGSFETAARVRATEAMRFAGIEQQADVPARALPIGIQRKVELARALAMRPRILLLDEIASGLNEAEKRKLAEVLRAIASEGGIPILLVEHDMGFVASVADHMIVLDAGRVIAEGEPQLVMRRQAVIESYLGTAGGALAIGA